MLFVDLRFYLNTSRGNQLNYVWLFCWFLSRILNLLVSFHFMLCYGTVDLEQNKLYYTGELVSEHFWDSASYKMAQTLYSSIIFFP